jgi:hypothetical protein
MTIATDSELALGKDGAEPPSSNPFKRLFRSASRAALYGTSVDVHQVSVITCYVTFFVTWSRAPERFKRLFRSASRAALYGTSMDVHQLSAITSHV